MPIPLSSNFLLSAQLPLDSRTMVVTTTARNAIPAIQRHTGLSVFVTSDSINYQLQGGTADINWVNINGSGLTITTGSGGFVMYPGTGTSLKYSVNMAISATNLLLWIPSVTFTSDDYISFFAQVVQSASHGAVGIWSEVVKTKTGGAESVAFYGHAEFASGGAQSSMSCFYAIGNVSTGTVSNFSYYKAQNLNIASVGTVSNLYGLYIDPLKTTNVINGYGIYQVSTTDSNIFAGSVRIGTTAAPTQVLDVKGKIAHSGGVINRVVALTDAATVTPNADTTDMGTLATLSQATLLENPSGTPTNGQRLTIRIKSSTARALTYGTQYRGSVDLDLPASSSGGDLTDYLGFVYHSADTKWDLAAKTFGF